MQWHTWLVFLLACIGLSLSPGPNSLLVLTHGALHGKCKTMFTIWGGVLGFVAIIALCMFGIGALIKTSLLWLTALRWLGGAYLVWLGVQVWRSPAITVEIAGEAKQARATAMFRQGFLSAITNPKGLLFFSAFLSQFIDPARAMGPQFAVVALTYACTEFLAEYAMASAAHRIRPWLLRVGRRFNRICGGVFVALGAALPLQA